MTNFHPFGRRANKLRPIGIGLLGIAFVTIALPVLQPSSAWAFTRGLASKVRAMQNQAYDQRLANAREAFTQRDYQRGVQEAQLALQHAATADKARPVHELLASAYKKLGDHASAAAHLKWLKDNRR